MEKIKRRIFSIIEPAENGDLISKLFDFFIIILIIINLFMVIADTFTLPASIRSVMSKIETVSVIIFTIEYALRVWTSDMINTDMKPAKARIRYIFSFMAIIDILSILPFYVPFLLPIDLRVLRTLRVTRLLRLFKVNRYTSALSTIGSVFKRKASQLTASMFVVVLLMLIASVLMYNIENAAQPETFHNAFDALWWAIATLTTVGYGDIFPITAAGRFLSGVIAILGIGLVAVPTGIISAGFMEAIGTEESEHDDKRFCPYCGHSLDK